MATRTLFVVGYLQETTKMRDLKTGDVFEIPVIWAEGMVGAFPAFSSRSAADAFANGKPIEIMEVTVESPTIH